MKYCSSCGQPVGDAARFCAHCGAAQTTPEDPIARAAARGVIGNPFGIVLWLFFVVIVTFQGVTLVRPMLEPLGAERPPAGKTFFIKHLVDVTFESRK